MRLPTRWKLCPANKEASWVGKQSRPHCLVRFMSCVKLIINAGKAQTHLAVSKAT